jgi:hypothetical protein
MTAPLIDIASAMSDKNLLGATLGDPGTWAVWRSVLKGAFALDMTPEEERLFAEVSGGRDRPQHRVEQLFAVIGRRGGKSRIAALVLTYLACFIDHSKRLSAGEVGHIMCLSWTLKQAQLVLGYCRAMLEQSPILAQQIISSNTEEIRLKNNIIISSHPASFKSIRGRTLLGVVLDELAMFRVESTSANPDLEVLRAVDHGLMAPEGVDHGMVVAISTPFGEAGVLYDVFQQSFGKSDPQCLVVRGGTRTFNPTQSQSRIDRKLAADPTGAAAELLAEFRAEAAAFCDRSTLEACIEKGIEHRAFDRSRRYCGFVDMSGGRRDSSVLAISTRVGERVELARVVEVKAPHDPAEAIATFANVLREYRLSVVHGDKYAANWNPREFRELGISYIESDKDKSTLFLNALSLFTSGTAVLLDDRRLLEQLCRLRRITGKSGKDRVEKRDSDYDDRANAACGSLVVAGERARRVERRPMRAETASGNYWI